MSVGKYSVPESILKFKPKGTMVKLISGRYYVYEYSSAKGSDGKRRTKMGKEIGSILDGIGFVPNSGFNCDEEITTLEFGEYAVVLSNSQKTLLLLQECFNQVDVLRIFVVALIYYIHGFLYMKDIHNWTVKSSIVLRNLRVLRYTKGFLLFLNKLGYA